VQQAQQAANILRMAGGDASFDGLDILGNLPEPDDAAAKLRGMSVSTSASTSIFINEGVESLLQETSGSKTEDEVKVYSDLLREIETQGEDHIYDDVLGELQSVSGGYVPTAEADADADIPTYFDTIEEAVDAQEKQMVLDDADGIGTLNDDLTVLSVSNLGGDTDEMMRRALQEALAEARKNAPEDPASDPNSILNDEEMMREINAVFDRANEQLLASIAQIREEQACCFV